MTKQIVQFESAGSVVDKILARHGLLWMLYPYRIVIASHPEVVVQAGPSFDLRESVLSGVRKRILAKLRKKRQRAA